jgi:hypothetical protein
MAHGTFKGAFIFIGTRPALSENENFADAD